MQIGSFWWRVALVFPCRNSSGFVFTIPVATVAHLTLMQKVTPEKIKRGEIKFEVIGKSSANPETVLEGLKKRMLHLEEERDGLKPQWLRDWQDSRGQGQSNPTI